MVRREGRRACSPAWTPTVIRPTSLGSGHRFFGFRHARCGAGPVRAFMTCATTSRQRARGPRGVRGAATGLAAAADDASGRSRERRAGPWPKARQRPSATPPAGERRSLSAGPATSRRASRPASAPRPALAAETGAGALVAGAAGAGGDGRLRRGRRGRRGHLVEDRRSARAHQRQARLVTMKRPARIVVARESTLAEPRGPKAVCVPPPPKALARSWPLPCWSSTTPIRNRHATMWRRDDQVVEDGHGRRRSSLLLLPRPRHHGPGRN